MINNVHDVLMIVQSRYVQSTDRRWTVQYTLFLVILADGCI